jgi:twitching motility protein PilT
MSYSAEDVITLIKQAEAAGATEIHFKVPNRPLFRVDGLLIPTEGPALTPQNTIQVAQTCLRFANKELAVATVLHEEIGFGLANRGRFHAILYRQRGSLAVLLKIISQDVVPLDELGLKDAENLLGEKGLVLLCGSRRLDAMASLIDRFNASHRGAVVTVEQPLTVLHRDAMAAISQREVGVDVPSISMGIESASRQRPDLIAITDIPDAETAEATLRAAEDGLQVIACVTAPTQNLAAEWLLRNLPQSAQEQGKVRLNRILRATVEAK